MNASGKPKLYFWTGVVFKVAGISVHPWCLDKVIDPAVVDTALALFALRDVRQAANEIDRGLALIGKKAPKFSSALSLSLGILCLDIFNHPAGNLVDLLLKRQQSDGG